MNISKAAIAPRQPFVSARDREHPLFSLYERHRSSCSINLIEASSFRDWLSSYERQLVSDRAAAHPRYPEFLNWMRAQKGGARRSPVGEFPHNFNFWLEGGRW